MRALRLFGGLALYYALLAGITGWLLASFPDLADQLPIGRSQSLILQQPGSEPGANSLSAEIVRTAPVGTLGESIAWMLSAVLAALLTALPVSWVYLSIRTEEEYDQSLVSTILILPITVTSIVIIVQNSLALAFSLAGIAGAVRFRNSLKSSGDALFILLSVGIGLAAGIGAAELAFVMSLAFSLCFVLLWVSEYGERPGMKRYMSDCDPNDPESAAIAAAAAAAAVAAISAPEAVPASARSSSTSAP